MIWFCAIIAIMMGLASAFLAITIFISWPDTIEKIGGIIISLLSITTFMIGIMILAGRIPL